jgi:cell division protein FtsI/penicillin-binding protein 2
MSETPQENPKDIGRRRFLKSLFGLGTAVSERQGAEAARMAPGTAIFWANLKNGQIGFPTGMTVPSGQPGSIMKLVTAAALREGGFFQGDDHLECRGKLVVHGHTFSCLYPHGNVDLTKAIGLSCNIFFAQAAQKIGAGAIIEYARLLGLNEPVGGYGAGSFPEAAEADAAMYALGLAPDLKPNALQIMRLAVLVALRGEGLALHNPGETSGQEKPFAAKLHSGTWACLEQGMRIAVREGTGKKLDPEDKLHLAVKTGTVPHGTKFESWAIGYFAYDNPRYAFCVRAPAGTSQEQAIPDARSFLFSTEWP